MKILFNKKNIKLFSLFLSFAFFIIVFLVCNLSLVKQNAGFSLTFSKNQVLAADQSNSGSYEMFEKIPGQDPAKNLLEYLDTLYKFGIAISAILAFVMISIAAFTIMVSGAGNASKIVDAKSMIGDAVLGLVIALAAYLFLYVINPDFVSATKEKQKTVGEMTLDESDQPSSVSNKEGYSKACPKGEESDRPIDYGKSKEEEQNFGGDCSNKKMNESFEKFGESLNQSAVPRIDGACLLKTIAHLETTCGANGKEKRPKELKDGTTVYVCSLMQLRESTAIELGHTDGCDEELVKDDELAIRLATDYIKKHLSSVSSLEGYNKIAGLLAGYNSGYATSVPEGKPKSALCDSSDCPGEKAFECCINPVRLDESISHAWNGVGLYKQCTGAHWTEEEQ